jgi:hypothetical protein
MLADGPALRLVMDGAPNQGLLRTVARSDIGGFHALQLSIRCSN